MAKVPELRRIVTEEFKEDQRELIDKLGVVLNLFMQQTIDALNGNLDSVNIKQEYKDITVAVNSSGIPIQDTIMKSNIKGRVQGMEVVRAENLTNPGTFPTGGIFITWTVVNTLIRVQHITGLQANQQYTLRVKLIG